MPVVVAWFAASIELIEPYDFWWNLKSGEIMVQTGQFLGTDVLVWTPVREPYSNPQWGSQLIFYWAYSLSPNFLLTLRAAIIAATVGLLVWLCAWRSGSLKAASACALIAYFTGWTNYGMRPQLLAFLPFIAYMLLLERKDRHPGWLPLLVPIMLFWVNVHGSFFLGVALIGIYAVGTLLEKLPHSDGRQWLLSKHAGRQALWMGAAVLATLVNPYFVGIYSYFFTATNDPIARALNMEWQPPTLYNGTGHLFYLNVLIFLTSAYISKRRMRPTEILLVLAFGYLALVSLRNVIWWGWVTAPIMAVNFGAWAASRNRPTESQHPTNPTQRKGVTNAELGGGPSAAPDGPANPGQPLVRPAPAELPALNWALTLILVGWALAFTPLWKHINPRQAHTVVAPGTPVELAGFLREAEVPAPLFNYMEWGGYLEWELYPRYQMFIDGRFEARKVEVWTDYLAVSRGRADWQAILDRYGVRTLVLNKQFHRDLLPFVAASAHWRKVYEDELGVVYVRDAH